MTSGYLLKDDFGVEGNYTAVKLCHCLVSASLIQEGFFFSVVHEKLNWNFTLKNFKSIDLPYFSLDNHILRNIHIWAFKC